MQYKLTLLLFKGVLGPIHDFYLKDIGKNIVSGGWGKILALRAFYTGGASLPFTRFRFAIIETSVWQLDS